MLRSLRRHRRRGEKESIDCSASPPPSPFSAASNEQLVAVREKKRPKKKEKQAAHRQAFPPSPSVQVRPSVPRTQLGCEGGREGLREGTDMHASAAKLWSETE